MPLSSFVGDDVIVAVFLIAVLVRRDLEESLLAKCRAFLVTICE